MTDRSGWFPRMASWAMIFVLFVPTAAIFAWTDRVEGQRLAAYLVAGVSVILLSSIQILRRARDIRWGYRVVVGSVVALIVGSGEGTAWVAARAGPS